MLILNQERPSGRSRSLRAARGTACYRVRNSAKMPHRVPIHGEHSPPAAPRQNGHRVTRARLYSSATKERPIFLVPPRPTRQVAALGKPIGRAVASSLPRKSATGDPRLGRKRQLDRVWIFRLARDPTEIGRSVNDKRPERIYVPSSRRRQLPDWRPSVQNGSATRTSKAFRPSAKADK
jgi:hypothetical protein